MINQWRLKAIDYGNILVLYHLSVPLSLTVLLAGWLSTRPVAIGLAETALETDNMITMWTGIGSACAKVTPGHSDLTQTGLCQFGTFAICQRKLK